MVIRVLLLILAVLLAVPNALLTGCRLIGGDQATPVPQLAAFAPWATLGWALVLLVLLAGRWWWVAVPAVVVLALQVAWVLPQRGSGAAVGSAGSRPGAVAVRVMTINTKVGAADVDQLLQLARGRQVDLLAVEEGQPRLLESLAVALGEQYPYTVRSNQSYPSGTVVWSRWPIQPLGTPIGQAGEIIRMRLQLPGAADPVTVTAVHTISPTAGRIDGWLADLITLQQASRSSTGAQIMLGDFNASRDHAPFRALLQTGLVDGAEAVRLPAWAGVTWPADAGRFPAAVRLDHVLVTPASIGVRSVRVVQVSGTDHRAVLADLEIGPRR